MKFESVFQYKSWHHFQNEAPFLAGPWKMRNLQITAWYVVSEKLQIVFTVSKPHFEQSAWEMPVKEEEYPEIRNWMKNYIPDIWKNLLLEEKDGGVKNNSGGELSSPGTV